jgi:hypothetical protein
MALTVEDGTGVAGANSYVSLDEVRAYALDRGATLPQNGPSPDTSGDVAVTALTIRAVDYLESRRYKGSKQFVGNLQWPRIDVNIDGLDLPVGTIPDNLKKAQCQLVIELLTIDPLKSSTSQIKYQKLESIEVGFTKDSSPTMPKVDALLRPLCLPMLISVDRA